MDHSTIVFFVSALCVLAIAAGLNAARREFARKRRRNRMARALRLGVQQAEGIAVAGRARVIEWQAFETASGRLS